MRQNGTHKWTSNYVSNVLPIYEKTNTIFETGEQLIEQMMYVEKKDMFFH